MRREKADLRRLRDPVTDQFCRSDNKPHIDPFVDAIERLLTDNVDHARAQEQQGRHETMEVIEFILPIPNRQRRARHKVRATTH